MTFGSKDRFWFFLFLAAGAIIGGLLGNFLEAVSYTHLDVYKRQPYGHARITGHDPVEIAQKSSAARQDNAPVHDIAGKFRRGHFKGDVYKRQAWEGLTCAVIPGPPGL